MVVVIVLVVVVVVGHDDLLSIFGRETADELDEKESTLSGSI